MPNCYIDDTYMDDCIIDPLTGKIRHCTGCEAAIQELRDDYDKLDNRKRKSGDGPFVEEEWDAEVDALISEICQNVVVSEAEE